MSVHYSKVPWRAIHEYLLEVGSARTPDEVLSRTLSCMERVIPFDVAVGWFGPNGTVLSGIGLSESAYRAYNAYYRFRIPFFRVPPGAPPGYREFQQDWVFWRDFRHTEYVVDFARPNELSESIGRYLPSSRRYLSVHRSRMRPGFSDRDRAALAVLAPHLDNLMVCFDRLLANPWPGGDMLKSMVPRLSRREAEVGSLLCRGLTAPEIADILFISARTVETHVVHLYSKLNVRTRREAIQSMMQGDGRGAP